LENHAEADSPFQTQTRFQTLLVAAAAISAMLSTIWLRKSRPIHTASAQELGPKLSSGALQVLYAARKASR
jgi:hypothetical protein